MEKSKKILIFSTAFYPFVGGAEVAIKEITDRISDFQFDLITAKLDRKVLKSKGALDTPEKVGNVNVYRLGFGISVLDKLILPFWGAVYALYLNSKNDYDFYWCMMASFGSGAAYIANILHFWKKVPITLTLQEGDSESHLKHKWLGLINLSWWLALKFVSEVTAISSYLAERAKKLGFKGKVEVIPNGVDIKKFEVRDTSYEKEEKEKTRKELNLGGEDIALITTSRLVEKNGVGDVIKSLKFLPENVKFVIFGTGELERELQLLTRNSNLGSRVLFKGFVPYDEIPKYLRACDIFIRPSRSEGMGNSFIEAIAAEIPVIGTPVGGIVDFLHDGETGYFCEPKNPESIAKAVQKVVNDPNKNQIIENAYNMVKEKYDWNIISSQMKEVFDKV